LSQEIAPSRSAAQHRDLLADKAVPLPADRRPAVGPIAVLPDPAPIFVDAVTTAGGVLAPLSGNTKAIMWLAEKNPEDLSRILDAHPGIEWVQLPWAGVDAFAGVLARYADKPFPLWTSAKSAYAEPVAEHALALTLGLLRRLPQKARETSWDQARTGTSLYGLNVLIVGAGGIAAELLRLLAPFDCAVTVVRKSAVPLPGADRTVAAEHLLEELPAADVVIIAAAATEDTSKMMGSEQFAAMKSSAVFVNIARGSLVDTDALVDALHAGTIASAGLDVTDPEPLPEGHPLFTEPNCLITFHSADTPEMTAPLLANRIRINVEAFLADGAFIGIVDPAAGY
jgi:phosphoglycerate dehydrogenase-like enzyme